MAQGGHGHIFIQRPRLFIGCRLLQQSCLLKDTHSSSVIVELNSIFSCFGTPKVVISDNGPQFSLYQFMRFAKEWDFKHDPSSPKHAKSNGMAESAVKTVKGLFKKVHQKRRTHTLHSWHIVQHLAAMTTNHHMRSCLIS